MNTIPALQFIDEFPLLGGIIVQALAPNPNRLSFAIRIASLMSFARNTLATGPEHSLLIKPANPWGCLPTPSAHKNSPAGPAASRGQNLAPASTELAHVAIRSATRQVWRGPTSVLSSNGRPLSARPFFARTSFSNCSAILSAHDEPLCRDGTIAVIEDRAFHRRSCGRLQISRSASR